MLVSNIILPIAEVEWLKGEMAFRRFMGTGFVLNQGDRFLTAKHVIANKSSYVAMETIDQRWTSVGLELIDVHLREDVAVFQISPSRAPTGGKLVGTSHHSSMRYDMWGYPEDLLFDNGQLRGDGTTAQRPELVFNSGYVRRRVTQTIPGLLGESFYELSAVAGCGSSGAPILNMGEMKLVSGERQRDWQVWGIYVGERSIRTGEGVPREIAYAIRVDSILDFLRKTGCLVA